MLFVLLALVLQCTYDPGSNVAKVAYLFGVHSSIILGLSVFDIAFFLGDTLVQVVFASRDDTTITFGRLFYNIFWKSHLVRFLTVHISLSTWPSCSSEPAISTWTGLNDLRTDSNLLSPIIFSMLILRAVNADMLF